MTDTRQPASDTVQVVIDGAPVAARPGELIIEAAERSGVFIPRFCYHPRMEPVGMCRMCLVEVSGPRGFSLQPACYLRVSDGQEIVTNSDKARKAQEGVLEFLLVNHPLDCPVCDKGGECPLQDQALSHGPGESRFLEEKRHWEKPIALSRLVELDRERCIQCARCTRFADEIAGDALIDFAYRGDQVEVATFPDRPFSSYFSGNTVQICPVGALTAKPYRFASRPWDLEQVETTCTTCSVGCRVVAQSSAGRLVRYLGIDVDAVNQSWLCDKGRFAIEAVHAANRLAEPVIHRNENTVQSPWHEALAEVVAGVRWALERGGPEQVGIIGGSRFTNEDAYAWSKLAKSVIKTDSIDAQLGDGLPAETVLGLPRATIDEAANAQVLVSLAPDLREELPVLYLRLRRSIANGSTKLVEMSSVPTSLTPHASARLAYMPGEVARLAEHLASGADGEIAGVGGDRIAGARALLSSSDVVFVLGRPSIAESAETIAAAAAILHDAYPAAKFLVALRRSNVHGALDMGLAPGLLPGRVSLESGREALTEQWGDLPEQRGKSTTEILAAAAAGELTTLILLGADPLGDFPDAGLARAALENVPFLVSLGTHLDDSSPFAHVLLPIAGDAERSGSTTNLEGRVSRVAQKVIAPGVAWPAWMVASEIARRLGADLGLESLESIQDEIAQLAPSHRGLSAHALARPEFRDGVVVPIEAVDVSISRRAASRRNDPIATPGVASVETQGAPLRVGSTEPEATLTHGRQGTGDAVSQMSVAVPSELPVAGRLESYQLRLVVARSLYDGGTLVRESPSLAPLAAKLAVRVHPLELARLGVSSGDELRVRSPKGALVLESVADDSINRNTVVLNTNVASNGPESATSLIDGLAHANDVWLETV